MKPRLLDLFCCAGGAAMGYHRAGFEVVGVDIDPQPNYPFEFIQGDALEADLTGFDAIHASPPCQAYSNTQRLQKNDHPDLLAKVREFLDRQRRPYVIENVKGAPMKNPQVLEGQMFGLNTHRPRLFETNWGFEAPLLRQPPPQQVKMGRRPKEGEAIQVVGNFTDVSAGREAMGIDWMTRRELALAIPPAYTEHIGGYLMEEVKARAMAEAA